MSLKLQDGHRNHQAILDHTVKLPYSKHQIVELYSHPRSIGMTWIINLFLLYTGEIRVSDQTMDIRHKFWISAFIWCYVHIDMLNNRKVSIFCIRWPKFERAKVQDQTVQSCSWKSLICNNCSRSVAYWHHQIML